MPLTQSFSATMVHLKPVLRAHCPPSLTTPSYRSLWQVIYDLTVTTGLDTEYELSVWSFCCAIVLLVLEVALIARYFLHTCAIMVADSSAQRASTLPLARLRERMRFVGKRFAPHVPYWQFVVWGRQFGLWLTTILPNAFPGEAAVDLNATTYLADADYISYNNYSALEEGLDALAGSGLTVSTATPAAVYVSAALALGVLTTAWLLHLRTLPFVYAFQVRHGHGPHLHGHVHVHARVHIPYPCHTTCAAHAHIRPRCSEFCRLRALLYWATGRHSRHCIFGTMDMLRGKGRGYVYAQVIRICMPTHRCRCAVCVEALVLAPSYASLAHHLLDASCTHGTPMRR